MLSRPLSSPSQYARFLADSDIPVRGDSRENLHQLHAASDHFNSRELALTVLDDPLLTTTLLLYVQTHHREHRTHDVSNVDQCLLMMGVEAFFDFVEDLPHLEDLFADDCQDYAVLLNELGHTRELVRRTLDLSLARHDRDPEAVATAVALQQSTGHLLRIHAKPLFQNNSGTGTMTRENDMERSLGCRIADIHAELMKLWCMPENLLDIGNPTNEDNPRVRLIKLATRLNCALDSGGWADAAMPEIIAQLDALLPLQRNELLTRLKVPDDMRERFQSDAE